MATDNKAKPKTATTKGKKRKQYLPYNKAGKKRGAYPLRPGVQGFFITCDGGRERQAAHEAINVIDSFFEELVHGKDLGEKPAGLPNKSLNKKITFSYSDDEEDDDEEEGDDEGEEEGQEEVTKSDTSRENVTSQENLTNKDTSDDVCHGKVETNDGKKDEVNIENQADNSEEPPAKKQCLEVDTSNCATNEKEKSIDKLIEAELAELGDKNKRRFLNLDSGCNGVVFVQMRKRDGDPGPKDVVQHMMMSASSTRKHMSRFILRVLPVEVACYASEEEITKAMKALVVQYFPVETENPRKTVCLIGIVEKYKELAKYNLRQLTSPNK
ncbi:hypothetical protein PTKIN_Ptkin11bG0092600 [Pterospermum kingtungense]